jgi:hypothetical protein
MAEIEAIFANQILNEVVNGFAVPDFEEALGMSRGEAEKLLARAHNAAGQHGSHSETFALSNTEAFFFKKALGRTLDELGRDEFETRTGYAFEVGQNKLAELQEYNEWER